MRCSTRSVRRSPASAALSRSTWGMPCSLSWGAGRPRGRSGAGAQGRARHAGTRCGAGREWDVRLGQPVSLHIAVPNRAGRGRQAWRRGRRRLRGHGRHGQHGLAAPRRGGARGDPHLRIQGVTRHRFAFEPAGDLDSGANRSRSSSTLSARSRSRVGPRSGGARTPSPLVGRDQELSRPRRVRPHAGGRAQLVSVIGEAGTGKSRLIAEFRRTRGRWPSGRHRRAQAACSSLGEPTYGVFGALFREATGWTRTTHWRSRARSWRRASARWAPRPGRGGRTGGELPARGRGGPTARHRARAAPAPDRAGRPGTGRASPRAGAAFGLVDDLQWADAASVDLLRDVVDRLADRPLMLLVAHRPARHRPARGRHRSSGWRRSRPTRSCSSSTACSALDDVALARLQRSRRGARRRQSPFRRGDRPEPGERGVLVREGERWACTRACER